MVHEVISIFLLLILILLELVLKVVSSSCRSTTSNISSQSWNLTVATAGQEILFVLIWWPPKLAWLIFYFFKLLDYRPDWLSKQSIHYNDLFQRRHYWLLWYNGHCSLLPAIVWVASSSTVVPHDYQVGVFSGFAGCCMVTSKVVITAIVEPTTSFLWFCKMFRIIVFVLVSE